MPEVEAGSETREYELSCPQGGRPAARLTFSVPEGASVSYEFTLLDNECLDAPSNFRVDWDGPRAITFTLVSDRSTGPASGKLSVRIQVFWE